MLVIIELQGMFLLFLPLHAEFMCFPSFFLYIQRKIMENIPNKCINIFVPLKFLQIQKVAL